MYDTSFISLFQQTILTETFLRESALRAIKDRRFSSALIREISINTSIAFDCIAFDYIERNYIGSVSKRIDPRDFNKHQRYITFDYNKPVFQNY